MRMIRVYFVKVLSRIKVGANSLFTSYFSCKLVILAQIPAVHYAFLMGQDTLTAFQLHLLRNQPQYYFIAQGLLDSNFANTVIDFCRVTIESTGFRTDEDYITICK